MNFGLDEIRQKDYYRGHELQTTNMEAPATIEGNLPGEKTPQVEATQTEPDAINAEREAQLELWMQQIKAFIRDIDVSSL